MSQMLLVDGNHLASRNRYAKTRDLRTSAGVPSGVVYGFFNSLSWVKYTLGVDPSRILVFFDGGRARKRLLIYPDYKSGRTVENPTPEEQAESQAYFSQLDSIQTGLGLLGIRAVKCRYVEADDLISIYASVYEGIGRQVVIFSGDKDLHQCVSAQVSVFDPVDELLSVDKVLEKWQVRTVDDILRMKCLTGDKSDAIKGVDKVGEVRARAILPFWDLLFTDDPLPPDKIAKYIAMARESRDTIRRNELLMRLPKHWTDSHYGMVEAETVTEQLRKPIVRDTSAFIQFCKSWELSTFLERLDRW